MQMRDYLAKGLSLFEMEWLNSNICFIRAKRNLLMLFSQHVSFTRSLKPAVRKFALRSLTFAPVTSASWDLYLETLNFLTLTVMVNQLKLQGPSNPKTKPTRNHHHLNLSYRQLLSALIFMQEPFFPSLSSSSMLSTGQSICKRKKKKVICILGTERTVLTLKVHFSLINHIVNLYIGHSIKKNLFNQINVPTLLCQKQLSSTIFLVFSRKQWIILPSSCQYVPRYMDAWNFICKC